MIILLATLTAVQTFIVGPWPRNNGPVGSRLAGGVIPALQPICGAAQTAMLT